MARKGLKTTVASDNGGNSSRNSSNGASLVNFQYARPPNATSVQSQHQQHQTYHRSSSGNGGSRRNNNNHRNTRPPQQQAAAGRRRHNKSSQFYLHSSPSHAFCLTRLPGRLEQATIAAAATTTTTASYTFDNVDAPVSWQAVRLVKYYLTLSATDETCPICLDSFSCARITKCGHVFCLVCLMHHVHSASESSSSTPKCPCCGVVTCLTDIRPVLLQSVVPPTLNATMRFVKLARTKHCSSPYLMLSQAPKRSSPRAAPCMNDIDANYCRFNYVHPDLYQRHLENNLNDLLKQTSTKSIFETLAVQFVQEEIRKATMEAPAEWSKMEQFSNPSAGMYQMQMQQQQQQHYLDASSTSQDEIGGLVESTIVGDERYHRLRGDSIVSYDSQATSTTNNETRRKATLTGGTLYLDNPDEFVFYQAEDGTLCFLCGFNMKCLQAEYATTYEIEMPHRLPLPDTVEGRIVELERVVLTPEKRQRFRFLSHLPIDSEIVFVDLNVGHLLSRETRQQFQKEFAKRKQMRASRLNADKAADNRQRRIEQARIDDLKARFQRVDPNDEFFRSPEPEPLPNLTGDEFGPSVASPSRMTVPLAAAVTANPALSFSHMIRTTHGLREYDFPSLGSDAQSSQPPALGSSPPKPTAATWGTPLAKAAAEPAPNHNANGLAPLSGGKKRNKGKKVLLFSIGGGIH